MWFQLERLINVASFGNWDELISKSSANNLCVLKYVQELLTQLTSARRRRAVLFSQ